MAHLKFLQFLLLAIIFENFGGSVLAETVPCDLREFKYGKVCVCREDYCDYLDDPTPKNDNEFALVTSSKDGLRFDTTKGSFNVFRKFYVLDYLQRKEFAKAKNLIAEDVLKSKAHAKNTRHVRLNIDRNVHHQKIVGFGGSFTGTVSYLISHLPEVLQDHVYKSFYSSDGLGFNLMRMSIGGSDFDLSAWAYNELPENDTLLSNFTLDARDALKVTQIKRLMDVSGVRNLRIKGAAWSAPPWMKTNNKWSGPSRLKEEYYQTWADYHLKWVEMMRDEMGLPIWAISTGNEPMNGVLFFIFVKFLSMGWTPKKQAIWVSDNLGPTIRNSKFKDLIIFGSDDQRHLLPSWFSSMNSSRSDALEYLNGVAVHFYWDEIFRPSFIDTVRERMPEKIMLVTESCIGDKPWQRTKPLIGHWDRGEKMARSMLQNLQHGINGWIDWNIILDEKGGPNYVNNFVDAPIIVNMTDTTEVFKQPMFYAMGHFSKFAPENSILIGVERSNINIDSVAFLRPDATISVVLFNSGNADVDVTLTDSIRGTVVVNVPPRSINTIIYR